ncbi:ATP-binding cassette domain-containing protein [bacterium]|nr:ATP-binding cassette domain-containing protein [bacterium]
MGLVGRNGHGKTTLLRLLTGEESPDSGVISAPKGYRIGYLHQQLEFTRPSVLEEAALGLEEEEKDQTWRAEKILAGLGFSVEDMASPPETFSGGYQVRLNLARLLVSEPDLLLLDEPTNFLDVVAIRWLKKYLFSWKGELLVVTHDRSFIDAVTTHIIGIHRHKVRKIPGDTGKYYSQIAMEEDVHEKSRVNMEKKRRQTEDFIRKFRAKARLVGLVQSRIRTLEKQKVPERLQAIRTLDFSFRKAPFEGKVMMEASELSYRWSPDSQELFRKVRLVIGKGDRIAVIGPNGKGKSTFLRVLAGELTPTGGEVRTHNRTRAGFFGQTNVQRLEPNRTVVEELLAVEPDRSLARARAVSGTMMFEGDSALKKVSVLSGGEKSRVLLGRLLLEPHNLLLLDEPTNHLDMDSCEALLDAIEDFEGGVVIVTHNENFLHNLAEKLLVFDRGGASLFDGTYQNFLDEVGWESEEEQGEGRRAKGGKNSAEGGGRRVPLDPAIGGTRGRQEETKTSKKESRKNKARFQQERTRVMGPLQQRVKEMEKKITGLESEVERINSELVDASNAGDGQNISELSRKLHSLTQEIEKGYAVLMTASEELEKVERELEGKFSADS